MAWPIAAAMFAGTAAQMLSKKGGGSTYTTPPTYKMKNTTDLLGMKRYGGAIDKYEAAVADPNLPGGYQKFVDQRADESLGLSITKLGAKGMGPTRTGNIGSPGANQLRRTQERLMTDLYMPTRSAALGEIGNLVNLSGDLPRLDLARESAQAGVETSAAQTNLGYARLNAGMDLSSQQASYGMISDALKLGLTSYGGSQGWFSNTGGVGSGGTSPVVNTTSRAMSPYGPQVRTA